MPWAKHYNINALGLAEVQRGLIQALELRYMVSVQTTFYIIILSWCCIEVGR